MRHREFYKDIHEFFKIFLKLFTTQTEPKGWVSLLLASVDTIIKKSIDTKREYVHLKLEITQRCKF